MKEWNTFYYWSHWKCAFLLLTYIVHMISYLKFGICDLHCSDSYRLIFYMNIYFKNNFHLDDEFTGMTFMLIEIFFNKIIIFIYNKIIFFFSIKTIKKISCILNATHRIAMQLVLHYYINIHSFVNQFKLYKKNCIFIIKLKNWTTLKTHFWMNK